MNNTKKGFLAAAAVVLAACLCISVLFIGAAAFLIVRRGSNIPLPTEFTPLPTQEPFPTLEPLPSDTPEAPQISPTPFVVQPADLSAEETLRTLESVIVPVSDAADLAKRLKGITNIEPTVPPPPQPYKVGDKQKFWVNNPDTDENHQVDATLRYINDVLYFWIEDGVRFNGNELKRLADTFADTIYPTDRKFFGSEWSPGIDGETRLYVLYATNVGRGIAGYFSSTDEIPPAANPYSNAHEMFVMSADNVQLGEEYIYGTMAHEFQHMIHYNLDRNETGWVNEGFSELAAVLNGYDIGGFDRLFVSQPDLQLTTWPDPRESSPHYGASFLFMDYFLGRFGDKATQAFVADPDNGMDSVDNVLKQLALRGPDGRQLGADDVFTNWTVANYLSNPGIAGGIYDYKLYPQAPKVGPTEEFATCPVADQERDVSQYGTDYIRLACPGDTMLTFQGATDIQLVPVDAHSGRDAFWSNQGDESDLTLTREFDLSGVSGNIRMDYQTWYDLEKDYDFVYVEASEDGQNWKILKTPSGTDRNITGANYGWGYTGQSGGWLAEQVDLSAYAGKKVQVRFEYVTDAAVNGRGLLLDDVRVDALHYASDFESDDGGWQANGFVRVANRLPQTFRVTLIKDGAQTSVEPLILDAGQRGSAQIHIGGDISEVIVVISGTTRFTTERASYRFSVR